MMESGSHDFTAHAHPVLAVRCPDCGKPVGAWCVRPSGHRASDLHRSRRLEADRVFIAQHGERRHQPDGRWLDDLPFRLTADVMGGISN